jgi:ATP-dependent RNA helicase RhlE
MGFIHDVRKVIRLLPEEKQTLFFSATMPPEIKKLADSLLHEPAFVSVTPVSSTAEKIEQTVCFVDKGNKPKLLVEKLNDEAFERVLVFSRTKHGANKIVKKLDQSNIASAAIHGNKSQGARTRALEAFKKGDIGVLVATDIAARGIDVDGVSHVINFDLPNIPETYVHRIGRTARAGREGKSVSFCDAEERAYLRDIERLIKIKIERDEEHSFPAEEEERAPAPRHERQAARRTQNNGGGRRSPRGNGRSHRGGGGTGDNNPRGGDSSTRGDGGRRAQQGAQRSARGGSPAGQGRR